MNYFFFKTVPSTIELNYKLANLGQEILDFSRMNLLGPDNLFGIEYQPVGMDVTPISYFLLERLNEKNIDMFPHSTKRTKQRWIKSDEPLGK